MEAVGAKEKRPNPEPVVFEDLDRAIEDKYRSRILEALGQLDRFPSSRQRLVGIA